MGRPAPSTGFHEQKPEILTLKPLPIPPGHEEGPFQVRAQSEMVRRRTAPVTASVATTTRSTSTAPPRRAAPQTNANKSQRRGQKDDVEDDTITDEHRAYLKLVFDALTDGVSGYTLGKSMKELPFGETADE